MFNKNFLTLIIAICILTSCTSIMYMDLLHIQKNQSLKEVVDIIKNDDFDGGISFISDEDEFEKDVYSFDNLNTKVLISHKYFPAGNDEIYYIFAFINDKLAFWGLPYEFANHSNPDINDIGVEASNIIKENYMED